MMTMRDCFTARCRTLIASLCAGCALALLLPAATGLSAQKKAPAKKPATEEKHAAAVKSEPSDAAFEQWLKKYGAYDRITLPPAPEADAAAGDPNALKRAEGLLLQGAARQALAVLEAQPPYAETPAEFQRLWLGGMTQRALGDPYKAVLWFSSAAKLLDAKGQKERLGAEPGLQTLWADVWRRQFWSFVGNPSASREALETNLRELLAQAEVAWGQENFWLKAKEALAQATGEAGKPAAPAQAKPSGKDKDAPLVVSEADRLRIAQALAAASIEDDQRAMADIGGLSDPALKEFWGSLLSFLKTGKAQDGKAARAAGYAKAVGFWSANSLAPWTASREEWLLTGSGSAAWGKFRTSVVQQPNQEAREAVTKELQSLLLSDEMARLLRALNFILQLQGGDQALARETWETLDKRRLPITLRLAGVILTQEDVKNVLPQEIGAAAKLSPTMHALLAAAGTGSALTAEAPFWTRIEVGGKNSVVTKLWPLDRLLVLSDWQARWEAGPTAETARRAAFLFPDTAFGYSSLTYLAQKAIEGRHFQLADIHLARMGELAQDKGRQATRLGLKAKLERESGRDAEALASYQELIKLGVEFEPRMRLDMATFLQLKGDFDGGRQQLLILWGLRDSLPKAVQAEILFWLGEGEHSLRNYDAALDYYLRLAYQYPKEPMWPTVAMYRSAMIYELKGNFEPARKLLQAVIATADTKEAKEAARNRLNALDQRAGKPAGGSKDEQESALPY